MPAGNIQDEPPKKRGRKPKQKQEEAEVNEEQLQNGDCDGDGAPLLESYAELAEVNQEFTYEDE